MEPNSTTSLSSCSTLSTDDSSIVLACSMIASYPAGYFSFTEPVYEASSIIMKSMVVGVTYQHRFFRNQQLQSCLFNSRIHCFYVSAARSNRSRLQSTIDDTCVHYQ